MLRDAVWATEHYLKLFMKILIFKNICKFVVVSAPADDLLPLFVVSVDDENPSTHVYDNGTWKDD